MAIWLITRPFAKGKPWLLMGIIFLTTYLLAAFSSAFTTIFLMWSFWYCICESLKYKPYTKFTTAVITGTILSCVMGSLILPFQQLPLVLLGAFSNATGQTVSYVAYMGAVFPFTLICIAEYMLVLKYVVVWMYLNLKILILTNCFKGSL